MIYTVTTNPNIDYYMNLRAPLRVGGINRSGHELLAPGGKGKGRNVPAFFRVLRGKRKGMGLVVRGEGGFC